MMVMTGSGRIELTGGGKTCMTGPDSLDANILGLNMATRAFRRASRWRDSRGGCPHICEFHTSDLCSC